MNLKIEKNNLLEEKFMDVSVIGKFIKEKRKEKGYTQQQFAKEIGVSRYTLHKIEKGYLGEVSFTKIWHALRKLGYDICLKKHNPFANPVEEPNEILCDEN